MAGEHKPVIYCFCNGTWSNIGGGVVAIGEDGTFLASHFSSNERYAAGDIGYLRDDSGEPWATAATKVAIYQEHYPDGFVMVWIEDPVHHEGVQRAVALNAQQGREAGEHGTGVFTADPEAEDGQRELTKAEVEQAELKGEGGYAV